MPITTTVGISGYYKITAASFENLGDYVCVTLEDKLTGTITNLSNNPVYSFRMNTTDDFNRFVVHFAKGGNCKSPIVNTIETNNNIKILPTSTGNIINFGYANNTKVNVSVTNILGQNIIENLNLEVQNYSLEIKLPEGYKGMYLIKVESNSDSFVQKFVKE